MMGTCATPGCRSRFTLLSQPFCSACRAALSASTWNAIVAGRTHASTHDDRGPYDLAVAKAVEEIGKRGGA